MSRFSRLRAPIQIAFGILAVGFLIYFAVTNWHDIVASLEVMNPALVVGALAAAFLGTYCAMLSWRSVVHSFGREILLRAAGEVTFTVQIGKYIPGGIWPIVAGSQAGQLAGLPGSVTVISMTLQLGVALLTGAIFSLGTLSLVPVLAERYWWLIVIVVCAGAALLLPPVMRRLLAAVFRLIRRPDLLPGLSGNHLGRAMLWALANWVFLGLQLWLLFAAVHHGTADLLLPSLSGYALSWVIGFLAIFAPAGAGVREGILVLLFAGSVPAATVLGVALVSRVLFVIVDVTLFTIAAASRRADARRKRSGSSVGPTGEDLSRVDDAD